MLMNSVFTEKNQKAVQMFKMSGTLPVKKQNYMS